MSGIAKDTTRLRVSDGVAVANVPQVVAERAPGDPSIQCDNVVGFPTGEFYGTTYRVITDDHGVRAVDKSSILDFVGTATNNVITIVSVAPGYVDSGSQRGDYVSIKPTASALNELADRLDETSTERALANVSNENLALRGRGVISGLGIVGASTGWSLAIGGKYATDGMFDEALLARNDGSKRRTSSRSTTPTAFAYNKPSMSSGQSVVSAIVQTAQPTGANSAVSYMQVNGTAATTGSAVAPTMEQVASAVGDTLCWAVIGYATCDASATSSASITTAVDNAMIPDKNISFTPLARGTFGASDGVMTGVKAGDTLRLVVNVYVRPNTSSDHDTSVKLSVNGAVFRNIDMVPTYRTSGNPTLLIGAYSGFYTATANNPPYSFSVNGGTIYVNTNGIWEVVR